MKAGIEVLTPVGGAIEFTDTAVIDKFDIELERQGSKDLRGSIAKYRLGEFETWFRSMTGRESDPTRELKEELCDESGLLTSSLLSGFEYMFMKVERTEGESTRVGLSKATTTVYLHEIWNVSLPDDAVIKISRHIEQDRSCHARLVTASEITAGASQGIKIGAISSLLLSDSG